MSIQNVNNRQNVRNTILSTGVLTSSDCGIAPAHYLASCLEPPLHAESFLPRTIPLSHSHIPQESTMELYKKRFHFVVLCFALASVCKVYFSDRLYRETDRAEHRATLQALNAF